MDPTKNHARDMLKGMAGGQAPTGEAGGAGQGGVTTKTTEETMKRVALGCLCGPVLSVVAFSSSSVAADPPQFQVDPFWPKPLPNNWLFGRWAVSLSIRTITSGCCSVRVR